MTTFKSTGATNYTKNTAFTVGKKQAVVGDDFALATASLTNGDTFILGQVSLTDRVAGMSGTISALTSATDNDLGFYTKNAAGTLVEIDKDILWDGITLATALDSSALLTKMNTSLDVTKTVGDHLGIGVDKEYTNGIFLVLTMNTKSSVDGTMHLKVYVEDGTAK